MAEKNEAEDGSSISLKSPCHMKGDRQQNIPYFTCFLMSQKCKFCFLLYLKEIYAQFVETNVLVKHNIYHELKLTIMDLDWQITWKHPVCINPGRASKDRRFTEALYMEYISNCNPVVYILEQSFVLLAILPGHSLLLSKLASCLTLFGSPFSSVSV